MSSTPLVSLAELQKCRPPVDAVHTKTEPSRQKQIRERQTGLELEREKQIQRADLVLNQSCGIGRGFSNSFYLILLIAIFI